MPIVQNIRSFFENIRNERDPARLRQVAQALTGELSSAIFSDRLPAMEAQSALGFLSTAERLGFDSEQGQRLIENAANTIGLAGRSSRFAGLMRRAQENLGEAQRRMANEVSNIEELRAGLATASPSERARLEAQITEKQSQLQELAGTFQIGSQLFGYEVPQLTAVQNALGNFAAADVTGQDTSLLPPDQRGERRDIPVSQQRARQAAFVREQPDGTFAITDAQGNIFEGGFASQQAALARQDAFVTHGMQSGIPESTLAQLPTSSLTAEQQEEINMIADKAADDTGLLSLLEITDADIAGFLKTASEESDPFFKQIFTRGAEDFESGLGFSAEFRKLEIAREQAQLASEMDAAAQAAAEGGTATSGIRSRVERLTQERAENIATTSGLEFEERVRTFGRSAEEQLGAGPLAGANIPQLNGRPIFELTPGVRGAVEREQVTAVQTRANELERQARIRNVAALAAANGDTGALEDIVSLI